jgi:uncharacterized Zn finger protein (UPF0148 family)
MPEYENKEVDHGDIRCDICGEIVLNEIEKESKEEIRAAIEKHASSTGHKDYSFYGRTKLEAHGGNREDQ